MSRLSLKLLLCLGASALLIFALLGYQNVDLHRHHLEEMTHASADSVSGIIKASTRDSMLRNQRDAIDRIIKAIGVEQGISRIRIFNKEGRISFSSDPAEVDTTVDKNAEACYRCHQAEQPLSRLNRPDRVRMYTTLQGERILGLINPIENEPRCSTAPCHAHAPGQRVLGVLDVTISLASVDATILEGRRRLIMNLAGAVVLLSMILALSLWWLVHRPIRRLFEGTRKVAGGDLESKIEVSSKDEIGRLADSFNRMTGELKRANDELKGWAQTLERRVEEKTAELRRAHDHMIQVERMASMGKLAAIVAHEINNPLAGILTSARLVLKRVKSGDLAGEGAEASRESLDMIASEASRCGEIVKGLLQFSRQTKGDYQPCGVKPLVMESLRLVQHKLDLAGVTVKTEFGDDLPPILCDPQEIRQALVAVFINACEAMTLGAGVLEVSARPVAPTAAQAVAGEVGGRRFVAIRVKDNGVGMDEETRKHIFEPFFSTKQAAAGVGLGLAVVSGIVSRHSGQIEVESSPGQGATFSIHLPSPEGR